MKKIAAILLGLGTILSFSAFAVTAQSGVVVGVNGGMSNASDKPALSGYATKNHNAALGASLGYHYAVNPAYTAGFEANYSNFGKTNYSGSASSGSFKNSALQLLLTGTYIMDNGFNTFVKAGAAQEQTVLSLDNSTMGTNKWLPAVAAGLGYEFLQNFNVYGQYERTFGKSWNTANTSNVPTKPVSLNVFSVGVNYTLPM